MFLLRYKKIFCRYLLSRAMIFKFCVFSGLEKSVKDLHRQTVSLERLKLVFNDEVEKAYKRIRTVFDEVRHW